MTREQVKQVLKAHRLFTTDPTLWDPRTCEWVDGSSFDAEFGVHDSYRTRQVMLWLGY